MPALVLGASRLTRFGTSETADTLDAILPLLHIDVVLPRLGFVRLASWTSLLRGVRIRNPSATHMNRQGQVAAFRPPDVWLHPGLGAQPRAGGVDRRPCGRLEPGRTTGAFVLAVEQRVSTAPNKTVSAARRFRAAWSAYTIGSDVSSRSADTCLRSSEACRGWLAKARCTIRGQLECSREPRHA